MKINISKNLAFVLFCFPWKGTGQEEINVKKEYLDLGMVWYPWVFKELK